MRLLILPALIFVGLVASYLGLSLLLPAFERWSERRAQARRERLAYERAESLLALLTVDPLLAERVHGELGKWRSERLATSLRKGVAE